MQVMWFDFFPGKTLSTKLFAVGSDTQVGITTAATEETNRDGKYSASYTGVATGLYEMRVYEGATCVGYVPYNITAASGDYYELTPVEAMLTKLPESYRSTNAGGSASQLLYELVAHLSNVDIAGGTKTVYETDGSTPAKTYTLNDSNNPTSAFEAS